MLMPKLTVDGQRTGWGMAAIVGFLPTFFSAADPRPAKEQIEENYAHGGGWRPLKQWQMLDGFAIKFPGEKPLPPLAEMWLREERIIVYESGWTAIIQPTGEFEVSKLD